MPVRYDRELVQTTIKAMKRIAEIKTRRERVFFKHRLEISYRAFASLILVVEWLLHVKNNLLIVERNWKLSKHPSSYMNP